MVFQSTCQLNFLASAICAELFAPEWLDCPVALYDRPMSEEITETTVFTNHSGRVLSDSGSYCSVDTQDDESPSNQNASPPRIMADNGEPFKLTRLAKLRDLVRQTGMAWLCFLLTVISFTLTVLYASQPEIIAGLHSVSGSIPYSIRLLRILSGMTDVLLQTCCYLAFERVQWILLVREHGTSASTVVSLNASTGVPGLFVLVFRGNGLSRLFAILRLLVIVLCPLLGIIVMSDVAPALTFNLKDTFNATYATGMSSFNESVAALAATEVDRLFSNNMATFLTNPEMTWDITSEEFRSLSCAQGPSPGQVQTCERTVFMPGSIPPELQLRDGYPEANIAMAYGMQGYILKFGKGDATGNWTFAPASCRSVGIDTASVYLCIHNLARNELQARMTRCPWTSQCLTDGSWRDNHSLSTSTSLKTSFRWADVAFHRQNGSIAQVDFLDDRPEHEASVNATGLLVAYGDFVQGTQAFMKIVTKILQASQSSLINANSGGGATSDSLLDGLLDASNTNKNGTTPTSSSIDSMASSLLQIFSPSLMKRQMTSFGSSGIDGLDISSLLSAFSGTTSIPGGNPLFPVMPAAYLQSCMMIAARYPAMSTTCTNFLQNFLAIPLFWCQTISMVRSTMQGVEGGPLDIAGVLGATKNDSDTSSSGSDVGGLGALSGGGEKQNMTVVAAALQSYLGVDKASLARLRSEIEPTKVALALLGYRIVVGQRHLWTYIVLATALLAACFAALVADGAAKWRVNMPRLGLFALLDMLLHLKLEEAHHTANHEGGKEESDSQILNQYTVSAKRYTRQGLRETTPMNALADGL